MTLLPEKLKHWRELADKATPEIDIHILCEAVPELCEEVERLKSVCDLQQRQIIDTSEENCKVRKQLTEAKEVLSEVSKDCYICKSASTMARALLKKWGKG